MTLFEVAMLCFVVPFLIFYVIAQWVQARQLEKQTDTFDRQSFRGRVWRRMFARRNIPPIWDR